MEWFLFFIAKNLRVLRGLRGKLIVNIMIWRR